jgi:hypothetical protein
VSPPAELRVLALREDPLSLRSSSVSGGLLLRLRQQFRSVEDVEAAAGDRWHVSTVAYEYKLSRAEEGREMLSWHWHPSTGTPFPHVHINGAADIGRKMHVPSGRVSIESVLRMLVAELGVPARREDWAAVVDEAEGPFIKYRRWHA